MESEPPARRRIVVDGSNLATEGRTLPSLAQLIEAIETFLDEHKGFLAEDVTVVVDASFGHRIDPGEVRQFEEAIEHGEMVTPPAGAVGRGDGFILRIAEKSGALVLSNDSFQEFHAERPWLFEPGRLIGGKPVPGVGWVFTPRTPVRGPRSRSVTAQSKREAKASVGATSAVGPETAADAVTNAEQEPAAPPRRRRSTKAAAPVEAAVPAAPSSDTVDTDDTYEGVDGPKPGKVAKAAKKVLKAVKATKASKSAKATKAAGTAKAGTTTKAAPAKKATKASAGASAGNADGPAPARATKATKAATATTRAPKATKATKTTKTTKATKAAPAAATSPAPGGGRQSGHGEALNDSMTFITFVTEHPIGSTLEGVVASFTSHGAHIDVEGMLCHVPLRGLGDPAPAKARSVLTKGETRTFELVSLDAARRRAELTLPGIGDSATA